MNITNQQIANLDALIGQYSGAVPQTMMNPDDRARRLDTMDRVRKYTKFAFGLARNLNIIKPILVALQGTLKNEKLEAYQKAFNELVGEKLEAKEMESRTAKLKKEHGSEALIVENNRRYGELMEMDACRDDGEPVQFYRIPITYLPGWNDADDCPEDARNGAVGPLDISTLMEFGILYDPDEETPGKVVPRAVEDPAKAKAKRNAKGKRVK